MENKCAHLPCLPSARMPCLPGCLMRSFATFPMGFLPSAVCRLPSSCCPALPDVLSLCFFLPSSASCFFLFLMYFFCRLPGGPSARRSICPEVHLPGGPSARRTICPEGHLPGGPSARRTICPEGHLPGGPTARRVVGCLPFCRKKPDLIPPPKNSRHFFKKVTPTYHI